MDYQLTGKTAYVSAGAHGMGEAVADRLTAEGAQVIVSDQDEAALRDKAHKWRGVVTADLSTAAGVERAVTSAVEAFGGPPDILVNNLGVAEPSAFEDLSDERWARSIELNLMGAVRTCRALVRRMAQRGGGAVVNTGSDLGFGRWALGSTYRESLWRPEPRSAASAPSPGPRSARRIPRG